MITFCSHSFGCRVNQAEKEELDRQLVHLGYTYDSANPALYIINTCSVTHKAEREARQLIYQTKRKHPHANIVVTGCAATNWIKTKRIYLRLTCWWIIRIRSTWLHSLLKDTV